MEIKEGVCMVGCHPDAHTRSGWMYSLCDDFLSASHNESEFADSVAKSPTLVFHPFGYQRQKDKMAEVAGCFNWFVYLGQSFPTLC